MAEHPTAPDRTVNHSGPGEEHDTSCSFSCIATELRRIAVVLENFWPPLVVRDVPGHRVIEDER